MKELTIEEKAKRYDEALKVLHKYDGVNIMFSQSLKEEMFPELKENEDDIIKKEIISAINLYCTKYLRGDIRDKMLAYLEKHCEHKLADKVKPKFEIGQTIKKEDFNLGFTIVKIEDGFYYNDTGSNFPFTDQDNWELVEQKPAWSEEDEEMTTNIVEDLSAYAGKMQYDGFCHNSEVLNEQITWFKAIKDRVQPQPKQEWSEEDIIHLGNCIALIQRLSDSEANWLKSLKERIQLLEKVS